MESISTKELLLELERRGAITSSKSKNSIISDEGDFGEVRVILAKGFPKEHLECRECRQFLDHTHYNFYQSRVDQNGYFMRANALCHECGIKSNKDRYAVLDSVSDLIPEKPKKGDVCPSCERAWKGNWHRHHVGDKFINWLCGHCNMSMNDQRTSNFLS